MTRRKAAPLVPLPSLADLALAASPAPWHLVITEQGPSIVVDLFDRDRNIIFSFTDDVAQLDQLRANLTWIVAARNVAGGSR